MMSFLFYFQLQNLLHKFQSPNLQEHLRYILAKAELRTFEAEEKKVQAKHRSDRVAKDVRSNLYSRIGLVKGTESGTCCCLQLIRESSVFLTTLYANLTLSGLGPGLLSGFEGYLVWKDGLYSEK